MSMLAGPRQKKKYCLTPRGKPLFDDNDRFGTKMLEKMGWSKGKGLGKSEDGSLDFVRAKYKSNDQGLGYQDRDDQWTEHEKTFNNLLEKLNGETNSEQDECEVITPTVGLGFATNSSTDSKKLKDKISGQSLEEKSKASKARVHYKKFTKGKDMSQYSEKDLANIFGKKVNDEPNIYDQFQTFCGSKIEKPKDHTINTGVSVNDYFKAKLDALKEKQPSLYSNPFGGIRFLPNKRKASDDKECETTDDDDDVSMKKKIKLEESADSEEAEPEEMVEDEQTLPKKKKNKQAFIENEKEGEEVMIEAAETEIPNEENPPKKKKKSKKSQQEFESNENQIDANQDNLNSSKKKKKSKDNPDATVENEESSETPCASMENEIPKKKKKKNKKESSNPADATENFVEESVAVQPNESENSMSPQHAEELKTQDTEKIDETPCMPLEAEVPKKKKKKNKQESNNPTEPSEDSTAHPANEIENLSSQEANAEELLKQADEVPKKKKKKSKKETSNPDNQPKEAENSISSEKENPEVSKKKTKKNKKEKVLIEESENSSSQEDNKALQQQSETILQEDKNIEPKTKKHKTKPPSAPEVSSHQTDLTDLTNPNKLLIDTLNISTFCAEKFRNLDAHKYQGSNLSDLKGYGLSENLELNIKNIPSDAERIMKLWSGKVDKYTHATSKQKIYNTYMDKVKLARNSKHKLPTFNLKSLKRKQVFKLV